MFLRSLSLLDSLQCLVPGIAAQVKHRGKNLGSSGSVPGEKFPLDDCGEAKQLHDAGVDADLCRALYLALLLQKPHSGDRPVVFGAVINSSPASST